jgi:ribonucleoside-diphosphate reductase alpha chain
VAERSAALSGADQAAPADDVDPDELAQSVQVEQPQHQESHRPERDAEGNSFAPHSSTELIEAQQGRHADAPLCLNCGTKMRPAGSCYVCEGCGSTSGCS